MTKRILFRDVETRSTLDLKDVGSSIYAKHPSTAVLCVSYCLGDGPAKIWRPGLLVPPEFKEASIAVAHNASFEMQIERCILGPRHGFPVFPAEANICTMSMAYACALPGKLEAVAKVLHLKHQKDVVGNRLMKAMSKPRKARKGEDPDEVYWWDDAARLAQLEGYCMADTEATRELYYSIPQLLDEEQRLWTLDQRINDRGFHLDRRLAEAARCIASDAFLAIDAELARGTNVATINQVAKLREWLRQSCGLDVPSLDKAAIGELLTRDDIPPQARRVIELRSLGAQAAVKKVDALLGRCEADGRIRGSFIFHAAGTGRWSARGAGVHNLKRPDTEDIEAAVEVIGTGDFEHARRTFNNPLAVIGDLVRSMIIAAPGHVLIGGDFSGIEARVTAWLAGEESALEVYRRFDCGKGPDPYIVAAAKIFSIDPDKLATEYAAKKPEAREKRQVGKASILAFGYQGGLHAFKKFEPNTTFTDEEIHKIKNAWRRAHPNIERFWHNINRAVGLAIKQPGDIVECGKVSLTCDEAPFLWMTLPSGRRLAYPHARKIRVFTPPGTKLVLETDKGDPATVFKDNSMGQWRDVRMYGGLATENLVQAIARDLLAEAMLRIDAAGYKIVTHVHDSIYVEVPKRGAEKVLKEFTRLMCTLPEWANGLPVTAKVHAGKRLT